MKIIAWNYYGIKGSTATPYIQQLTHAVKPDMYFLAETKVGKPFSDTFFACRGIQHYHVEEPIGRSGGLWLWWQDHINLNIIQSYHNFVSAKIEEDNGYTWLLLYIYSPLKLSLRRRFWDQIQNYILNTDLPICVMGDMNSVTNQHDEWGGNTVSQYQVRHDGPAYTWANNRKGTFHIRERLDRVMVNSYWYLNFPTARVLHLPKVASE